VELLRECGVDKAVNTCAAHFARLSRCAKTQSVTFTHFFVVETVTINIATAGDFLLDLGFPVSSEVLGFLLKMWGLFVKI